MENLAQFEADLWEAADNLRANSKLSEEETDSLAARVYDFVWQRSSAGAPFTATAPTAP